MFALSTQNQLEEEEEEEEGLVSDLICNFVVPEVQKQLILKHMQQRQAKYLQEVYGLMHNQSENLPSVDHLMSQQVSYFVGQVPHYECKT